MMKVGAVHAGQSVGNFQIEVGDGLGLSLQDGAEARQAPSVNPHSYVQALRPDTAQYDRSPRKRPADSA